MHVKSYLSNVFLNVRMHAGNKGNDHREMSCLDDFDCEYVRVREGVIEN